MTVKVCYVGDDAHPPWNHASSILTKRLIECMAMTKNIECSLATSERQSAWDHELAGVEKIFSKTSGSQSLDAVRLSLASRNARPDILHLVGTNALVFSPISKILGRNGKIIRHIFTPYDTRDRAISPLRNVANRLFIDSYAFTTPKIGRWEEEVRDKSRRFILRPPLDTGYYSPGEGGMLEQDNTERPIVLYMGPLMPTRFPMETVLGAVKRLKEKGVIMRLVVLTSASRTTELQCETLLAMSRKLALSNSVIVRRVDLTEDERIRWYNTADVVLFPYLGPDPEKLADPPFGILEAMSCGRVVLATDVLSVSDVVQDGVNGFLMPAMNIGTLEEGLKQALDPNMRNIIGRKARELIVGTFDYSIVARRAMEAYTALLG